MYNLQSNIQALAKTHIFFLVVNPPLDLDQLFCTIKFWFTHTQRVKAFCTACPLKKMLHPSLDCLRFKAFKYKKNAV